jgi:hypothetical protein
MITSSAVPVTLSSGAPGSAQATGGSSNSSAHSASGGSASSAISTPLSFVGSAFVAMLAGAAILL